MNPRGDLRPPIDLANRPLQPLGYLSLSGFDLAEGVGFEPTKLALAGFQDRYLQPLGHPSILQGLDSGNYSSKHLSLARLTTLALVFELQ